MLFTSKVVIADANLTSVKDKANDGRESGDDLSLQLKSSEVTSKTNFVIDIHDVGSMRKCGC